MVEEPALEHPTEVKQIAARTKTDRYFKAFAFMVLLVFARVDDAAINCVSWKYYHIVTIWQ